MGTHQQHPSSYQQTATLLCTFAALFFSWSGHNSSNAFFIPNERPQSYEEGDMIKLYVNKMTSTYTLIPVEYYQLPFCQPEEGPEMANENLGQFLAGDRIKSSPYELRMKEDMYCKQLCISNLGAVVEQYGGTPNKMVRAIRKEYHNNWIVDNLSAASKAEDDESITTRYWQGFPVGFIADDRKAYVNNHVNIEVHYHQVEMKPNSYRVVRFIVEPFSIHHKIRHSQSNDDDNVVIENPIPSCKPDAQTHTDYDMIYAVGRKPQPASGKVLFTYDVIWKENPSLHWASRWDIYLSMDHATPQNLHFFSVASSLVIIIVLSAMIAGILIRNLRRHYVRYIRLATDSGEKAEDLVEFGWKLVYADVFRPPEFSPLLLAVSCGNGAQLLCTAALTTFFAALGFLSPANRGALLTASLLLHVLMGGVSGYITARLYKTFKGKSRQRATALAALGLPSVAFLLFFFLDICATVEKSTYAVPFTTLILLLGLWFGISTPLVFLGAYFGYKQDAIEFPINNNTSPLPRQIPVRPWFMGIPFTLIVGGVLPFGACFVEFYLIMGSMWMDQYYYSFAFLFLVMIILVVVSAEIAILSCYFQLCSENYHWWWHSFCAAGSVGLYIFLYSIIYYFNQLHASRSLGTWFLYFGYMSLISLGLFLMTGFIGVASSLWFNKKIFASIEIH